MTDALIKCMNFWTLLTVPKKRANFRFANIQHDASDFAGQIKTGQLFKIYGRITSRYNFHPLQRFVNLLRCFDVIPDLADRMERSGNISFYHHVCEMHNDGAQFNHRVDLTKIDAIQGLHNSGRYLYEQLYPRRGAEAAELARICYMRGFSRIVRAADYDDWEALRSELRSSNHAGNMDCQSSDQGNDALLFAVSYKGKSVKITRRMRILKKKEADGTPANGESLSHQEEEELPEDYVEEQELTTDFVDDFRWSQIVRSCMTYARRKGASAVRIWVDRLVMMGLEKEVRKRIYDTIRWEDFGLFAYAVCPVVRVYDSEEREFGTDFWRKLETVMGVAGRGLVVDDYMLRKFDSIYYGEGIYTRLQNGLSMIGGGGEYIRAVTLAMATAVLTDGVTVAAVNEDIRTKDSIQGWKAWALRTIAEGAYSSNHALMMMSEKPYEISCRDFKVITFWESMVSRSLCLTGKSYMDMSFQRSTQWRKSGSWDGIIEWVGMLHGSCVINERAQIEAFLDAQVETELYAGSTGHVASMMSLTSEDEKHKRTLVVNLARFSTAISGHVTAVAEATGLWGENLLPWYLRYKVDPDRCQKAVISHDGEISFDYEPIPVEFLWSKAMNCLSVLSMDEDEMSIPIFSCFDLKCFKLQWPWEDEEDVGEALFDNLLMHGLYKAGIKTIYRKMKSARYTELGWR